MSERKIDEAMVKHFIWAVNNYFTTATSIEPETSPPYLVNSLKYFDYTGVIGIEHILDNYHTNLEYANEEDKENIRLDLAGELTNTIAGNVRNHLGEGFLISVPVVFRTPGETMHLQKGIPSIAFPIKWNGFECVLVVALEYSEPS